MKIRAKLRDVIMLPDNDFETDEIKRLMKVSDDETSEIFMDIDMVDFLWGDIPKGKIYFMGLRTKGIIKDDWVGI